MDGRIAVNSGRTPTHRRARRRLGQCFATFPGWISGLVSILLGLAALTTPLYAAAAPDTLFGVLQWRGYPLAHLWRMEWDPVAAYSSGQWSLLPADATPPVDTVFAPDDNGFFLPETWGWAPLDCDSVRVALGRWEPRRFPADIGLDDPLVGTAGGAWHRWPLSDPASVWHTPDRPEMLVAALSGLTHAVRTRLKDLLPPGLETDPSVIWIREGLRLADPLEDGSLELVGRFEGAVRLRGGGASSPAVVHFWVRYNPQGRFFRYLLLDLPRAGAARLTRRAVAVLQARRAPHPIVLFREETASGRRYVVLGLRPDGRFHPLLRSGWEGCPR